MMLKAGGVADINSYNTLIKACAEARDVAIGVHWLSLMLKAVILANTFSYLTMIRACAGARDTARADHSLSMRLKIGFEAQPSLTAK